MNPCYLISTFIFLTIWDVCCGQGWEILHSESSKENPSSVLAGNCFTKPIGVSDQKKIPDRQMTASSIHSDSQAAYGRLNGNRGDGWCTKEPAKDDDWLQIDLGKQFEVCGVATQGDINGNEWVTDFKMSYLSDGRLWTAYKDGTEEVEFNRKGTSKTVDQHKLPVSVSARYFRFHPTKRNKWNCLRVEIYGVPSKPVTKDNCVSLQEGDQSLPEDVEYTPMKWFETPSIVSLEPACTSEEALGLANGIVTNQQMSASSSWDKDHGPENARLNLAAIRGKTGGWAANTNNQNQFLQVDFWRNVKITKLQTQGYHNRAWWVQKYALSYSADHGSSSLPFQKYQENGADKVFTGNTDSDSVVTHVLQQPIIARYVQLKPIAWNNNIAMRAEFYGCVLSDRYQAVGRKVHMDFVQEHLKTEKKINFADSQERSNDIEIEILADTVYVKGNVRMGGIKKLTLYSREVFFLDKSKLDLRAPAVTQKFRKLPPNSDGDDGMHGVPGPLVEIFADTLAGQVSIVTSGGDGNQGQDGSSGRKGADNSAKKGDKTERDCLAMGEKCSDVPGERGEQGGVGEDGGYAGYSGNGGNAGRQTINVRTMQGKLDLKTCPGKGSQEAKNGVGGVGGRGGLGGRGAKCKRHGKWCRFPCTRRCRMKGQTKQADRGPPGDKGRDGQTPVSPGSDGQVESSYLQKLDLSPNIKGKYPLALIKLITRYAEDLIWSNKITKAEAVLKFIVTLTVGRSDASALRKVAKRRQAFINKEGFDRFGRNQLFAPLMKWEVIKNKAMAIRKNAEPYENAYNEIRESVQRRDDIREVLTSLPVAAKTQVDQEKERLTEARRIAISQKGVYVKGIKEFESRMSNSLEEIAAQLPDVYKKSQFNQKDLVVILQGLTGFFGGIVGKDPFGTLGTAIQVAGYFATKCNSGSLQDNLNKTEKWLAFGKEYAALEDSSDLDFDKMDIESVPEVMKANLEMNKGGLAADLVCMLDERSLPRYKAKFEAEIGGFFDAGAARIDLIAKVVDLDNSIGGYNFDILNLEETSNAIGSLSESGAAPIADNIQQTFLDDLLTSYRHMEDSFAIQLLETFKAFEFRTLWKAEDKLFKFERTASETAKGSGKLQGVLQLTKSLEKLEELESKGRQCFTKFRYTTSTDKWSFDNVKNAAMFDQLHQGDTSTFTLKLSESCETCYNVRLLKMYVELYGDTTQDEKTLNFPARVLLRLRHMSRSIFRDAAGETKIFHQPLASQRKFEFNRFEITNTIECNKDKKKGKKDSLFCMEKDDIRLQPMCCHFLSDLPCDILLGAEECTSPFGTYEISMPIDNNAPCEAGDTKLTSKNCKDFDRSKYTKMNVWIHYLYWSDSYPTGPDDPKCENFKAASPQQATPDYFNS